MDEHFSALRRLVRPAAPGQPAPIDSTTALMNEVYRHPQTGRASRSLCRNTTSPKRHTEQVESRVGQVAGAGSIRFHLALPVVCPAFGKCDAPGPERANSFSRRFLSESDRGNATLSIEAVLATLRGMTFLGFLRPAARWTIFSRRTWPPMSIRPSGRGDSANWPMLPSEKRGTSSSSRGRRPYGMCSSVEARHPP